MGLNPMSLGGRHFLTWPTTPSLEANVADGPLRQALAAAAAAAGRDPATHWATSPLLEIHRPAGRSPHGPLVRTITDDEQPWEDLIGGEQALSPSDRPPFADWTNESLAELAAATGDFLRTILPSLAEVQIQHVEPNHERPALSDTALLLRLADGLSLQPAPERSSLGPPGLEVMVKDQRSGRQVPLEDLSSAECRWTLLCLKVACVLRTPGPRPVLVLDEPERGLHPLAVRDIAAGLERLAIRADVRILLASHSPEFLSLDVFRLVRIERSSRSSRLVDVPRETLSELVHATPQMAAEWGIRPADLLTMVRMFVCVEGDHDAALLRVWLGEELARSQSRVVPMRGTDNLNTVLDAQLLMDYSEAHVIVVLDRTRQELETLWDRTRGLPVLDALRALNEYRRMSSLTDEEEKLLELLRRAIETAPTRLSVHAMSKPDVMQYLPASRFDPEQRTDVTWDQLFAEYKKFVRKKLSFKGWLHKRGVDVTTERQAYIAADLDPPPDFVRLAARLWDVTR